MSDLIMFVCGLIAGFFVGVVTWEAANRHADLVRLQALRRAGLKRHS